MGSRLNGFWVTNDKKIHDLKFRWNTERLPELDPSKVYYIGIDQSLRNTGIWIRSSDYTNYMQTEFKKVDQLEDWEFADDILDFLDSITKKLQIKYVILEEVLKFKSPKFGKTVDRLTRLVENLKSGMRRMPQTKGAIVAEMNNKKWKRFLKQPDRPKGKSDDKYYIAKDMCVRYPFLKYMMDKSSNTYDSFDAVGVLEGYLMSKFGDSGTVVEQNNKSTMIAFPVYANSPQDLEEKLPRFFRSKRNVVDYNSSLTLYKNVKGCPINVITSIKIVNRLETLCVKWLIGEGRPNDRLFLIVAKKANVPTSTLTEIKDRGLTLLEY